MSADTYKDHPGRAPDRELEMLRREFSAARRELAEMRRERDLYRDKWLNSSDNWRPGTYMNGA